MRTVRNLSFIKIWAATACMVAIVAAAPLDPSIAPLAPQGDSGSATIVAKTVTAENASFEAAPVPDPDVDAPADSSKPDTTVSPKLLSTKTLFQGDGYAYASSEQTTLDNKRSSAPGLRLTVPLSSADK